MSATWDAFASLAPIELEVTALVIHDVLMSDFGMDDDWSMRVRRILLKAKDTDRVKDVKVRLHPDGCMALWNWLADQRYSKRSEIPRDRRMDRLRDRLADGTWEHARHPWLCGRVMLGSHFDKPSLPAWAGDGLLFPTQVARTRPVILRPIPAKAGNGLSITKFTIEEVTWHSPEQSESASIARNTATPCG